MWKFTVNCCPFSHNFSQIHIRHWLFPIRPLIAHSPQFTRLNTYLSPLPFIRLISTFRSLSWPFRWNFPLYSCHFHSIFQFCFQFRFRFISYHQIRCSLGLFSTLLAANDDESSLRSVMWLVPLYLLIHYHHHHLLQPHSHPTS